jgi:tetratricopeptide (TPR) repeat protein
MVRRLKLILFLGIFLFDARPVQAKESTCLTASGQEAVDLCTNAIVKFFSSNPVRVLALRKRAFAYLELKQFEKAKRDIDEVISSGLTSAEDWWVRGMILAWLDQWELALKDQEKANGLVKGRADFLVELASAQVSTGRFQEGANTYSSLVSMDATNPVYYAGRGQAYYYAEDYDRALADYTSAVIHGRSEAEYWFKRGLVREAMGDETNAEKDYTEAIKKQPDNAEFRNVRGRILHYLGDYDSALYDFDQSIAKDPEPDTFLNRASLQIYRNELDLAKMDIAAAGTIPEFESRISILRGRILAAGSDFSGAIAVYETALQRDPSYVTLLYWRATAHFDLGQYQKAYDDYSKLLAEWPKDEVVRLDRANTLFQLDRLAEAHADVDEALKLDPHYAAAFELRAKFYNYESQWQNAITASNGAIGIDPDRTLAYYRRAFAKWGLDDLQGADSDYEKAIALDSKFASAHAERAEVVAELKRFDEAHREIETAMKMEPKFSGHVRRLGRIYELESRLDEAAVAYQTAIDLDPDDGWNYEGRAWFNISSGKWADADNDCRLMLKIMPKEPASFRCIAHVKWAVNDIPGTLETLAQALRLDPKYGAAYYDKGRIMFEKADYEEAAANFSTAISLNYRLADALVYRGDTLRNLKLENSALKDYRQAAELANRGLAPLISRRISGLKSEVPASLDDSSYYPQDRRRASQ